MPPPWAQRLWRRIRGLPWRRFIAGVLAGGVALALTFVLRLFGLGIFLPEVATEWVVARIPGGIESFFITSMGEGAKLLGLVTALVVFLIIPGIYAVLWRRVEAWITPGHRSKSPPSGEPKEPRRWAMIAIYTAVPSAITLLVVLPILGGGFLGSNTDVGPAFALFSQVLGAWLYASVLDYLLVEVRARHPEGFNLSRRQFIAAAAIAAAGAVLAIYGLGSIVSRPGRLVFGSVPEMQSKEITPVEEFYTVTKNVVDPTVDAGSWRLEVAGLVSTPASYTYDELIASTLVDRTQTLECVSNAVGGNLIGTAMWSGVSLKDLLDRAGVSPDADWVEFESAADGYTVGVPLARAADPASLVALRMNGLQLPPKHGFPARILVPGVFGMFNAKWVTRIVVLKGEYLGFWQQKGWTNRGLVRTTAIIATPPDGTVAGPVVEIGGVAFAGDRGISRVEVSTDCGATWNPATLSPPLSGLAWVLWTYNWSPLSGGSKAILARAVDGTGTPQEVARNPPFPDGSSGYDSITLLVSG